jgi:hypothetical protein
MSARRGEEQRRAQLAGADRYRAEQLRARPTLPGNSKPPAATTEPQLPAQQQVAGLSRPELAQPTAAARDSSVIRFSVPLAFGPPPINGQSIEKLITGEPEFPPIEGLDEKLWKHPCGTCHKWDQRTLCEQGKTYVKNPAAIFRHQHPFGAFKVAVMDWAKTGCEP